MVPAAPIRGAERRAGGAARAWYNSAMVRRMFGWARVACGVAVVSACVVVVACGSDPDGAPAPVPSASTPSNDSAAPEPTAVSATTAVPTTHGTATPVTDSGGIPSRIDCVAYYRPLGNESVAGASELPVGFDTAAGAGSATAPFETMTFEAAYTGDDGFESPTLSLSVTDDAGEPLTSVLYQLGGVDLRDVQFAGGHGFTGLHYVDHDGAQLQFWCAAT